MERERCLALLLLVVGLLAGAAARADACRPVDSAGDLARGAPTTAGCFDGVHASVVGGGFSRARLDASRGFPPSPPARAPSSPPVAKKGGGAGGALAACNSSVLASQLVQSCVLGMPPVPPRGCCAAVLDTVDNKDIGCLCSVEEEGVFAISNLGVPFVWELYGRCGGRRQKVPKDTESCDHAPAPAPPPPPPPPSSPPPPAPAPPPPPPPEPRQPPSPGAEARPAMPGWEIAFIVLGSTAGIVMVILVVAWVWVKLRAAGGVAAAPLPSGAGALALAAAGHQEDEVVVNQPAPLAQPAAP